MTGESSFSRAPETGTVTGELDPDYAAIHADPRFTDVRRRISRFVFPVSALFFCWYLTFVLLAAYAPGFMGLRVFGNVTVGLLLGLSQFVSIIVIMLYYARFARRRIDPRVAALRSPAGRGPFVGRRP